MKNKQIISNLSLLIIKQNRLFVYFLAPIDYLYVICCGIESAWLKNSLLLYSQ